MLLEQPFSAKRRMISLTPLIDVVFILLLFFMLSSGFTHWRQMDITAASESYNTDEIRTQYHLVLQTAGEYEFDKRRYPLSKLSPVKQTRAEDKRSVFVVSVAEGVTTQQLIDFLDQLKTIGVEKVSLAGLAI
ncbi:MULTISPECIES: biopolymer transporter ExbD [unclassified Methylophaga]|jgi:biopolymer transport protein ExbD|uniref:ExbD/TolR family protein n=1 Tax=unclassified Methylophaga TaxID=2629249 RepID=UPI000C98B7B9|nr:MULTISPECIES: biopolymer transporter ExbD [unclassified Methylophaga]MAK67203.1 biopolymer transporter TolR [Methylophaga sp.]MAY18241.1 biopolymer transporter TolR [Methylophaga sp.]HAO25809.1 biopolymer transporter ExbD [Methylophaga sp.]HCD04680.1 biopolymer transporter ExbD [Methylophaga sp.]|tara:strand:- start:15106 stop:15504 length:399 start_codon:yes stop_codon:yes gene_type:complete